MWWCWWLALAALGAGARAQAPRPVCARGLDCHARGHTEDSYDFLVTGKAITYKFIDDGYLALNCRSGIPLDEPALPRFEPALRVRELRLSDCWPRAGSYAAALRALNVTALDPPGPGDDPAAPTWDPIFLTLKDVKNFNVSVLAAMPTLRNLTMTDTSVTAADLAMMPAGLEQLNLLYSKIDRVPAAALARLPRLAGLWVADFEPVKVEAVGNLSRLYIDSSATLVNLSLPDTLGWLWVSHWAVRRPEPWRSCAGLEQLIAKKAEVEALPDRWLARCTRLRTLELRTATKLKTIASDALRGASALEEVVVSWSRLEALPAGLLDHTPALRVLDLLQNRLHTLPGLASSALDALGTVTSLSVLRLGRNTALDACPRARAAGHDEDTQGSSPLRELANLSVLDLSGTGTRHVCADWRRLPRLESLDLSDTQVTQLNYNDLQYSTAVNITVQVPGVDLLLRREDYESVAAAPAGPTLTLALDKRRRLRCDCELYWAAAALRLPGTGLRETGGRCEDGSALRDVPLDELVCVVPGACPANCTCGAREDAAWGRVLRLDCAGAELRRLPHVDARAVLLDTEGEPVSLDLRLAGNDIDQLAPEDLPPELAVLDLRNNSLSVIDAATAAALVLRADRRVLLAGNPLDCSCRAAAALSAMRDHPAVFQDWTDATCSDGTRLILAAPAFCNNDTTSEGVSGMSVGGWAALSAALALGAAVVGAVLRVAVRRRRRAARRARLPETLRLERLDAGEWVYDAFVSFAHADEAVVRELVARLEGGAAPLRLCVHYRDWMPGGWIPAQIAASVRVSRRTVAVVSEAFLRSKWAHLEFREAYAAAMEAGEPRLVLVLLEDPARLPLDAELRVCVEGSTYVRWGDPWFWEKLQRALPPPMARPVSESPATPPASPPGTPAASPSPPPGPA